MLEYLLPNYGSMLLGRVSTGRHPDHRGLAVLPSDAVLVLLPVQLLDRAGSAVVTAVCTVAHGTAALLLQNK
jgi:hypothetical protein